MFLYFQKFKQISKLLFNSAPNTSKLKTSVLILWWISDDVCYTMETYVPVNSLISTINTTNVQKSQIKCQKIKYILCKFLSSLFDYYESILFSLIGGFFFFTKTTSIIHCTNNNVKWEANVSWHKLHESISYLMQII